MARPTPKMMNEKAATAMAECTFAIARGMHAQGAGKVFMFDPDARDFWLAKHAASIQARAGAIEAFWDDKIRDVAVVVAERLGAKAAELAIARDPEAADVVITLADAQAASQFVHETSPECQAAALFGAGGLCDIQPQG